MPVTIDGLMIRWYGMWMKWAQVVVSKIIHFCVCVNKETKVFIQGGINRYYHWKTLLVVVFFIMVWAGPLDGGGILVHSRFPGIVSELRDYIKGLDLWYAQQSDKHLE